MNYQVRFKDIDPDTGLVSQDKMIAVCENFESAELVQDALTAQWFSPNGACDPGREFYILDCSTSL
jgi:hypothetical protein